MAPYLLLAALLAAGPDDAKLKALADAYQANRQSFVNVDCRFKVQFGSCATLEDALAGRFLEQRDEQWDQRGGRWTVRGPFVRYEYGFLLDPAAKDDDEYLISGNYLLQRLQGSTTGNDVALFDSVEDDGFGIRFHPFNIDIIGPHEYSNPPRYVDSCLSGRFVGRYNGIETIQGIQLETVSIGPSGMVVPVKMGFDPLRGHLLCYMQDSDPDTGRLRYAAYVTSARECTGGRWIPLRWVNFRDPESAEPHSTTILTVTDLNVDDPPPDESFEMVVPAATRMRFQDGRLFADWQSENELTITAANLPATYEAYVKAAKNRQRLQAIRRVFGGLLNDRGHTWLLIALAGVVGLVAAIWWRSGSGDVKQKSTGTSEHVSG
ncbi:MAG: hypothetical protein JNG89_05200 [Planctomycetaceae bacterium]|nr:hypothetical protein [Planctomycetaceae bacterium]